MSGQDSSLLELVARAADACLLLVYSDIACIPAGTAVVVHPSFLDVVVNLGSAASTVVDRYIHRCAGMTPCCHLRPTLSVTGSKL
jgi:hypothetical protein